MRSGGTVSCGCLRRNRAIAANETTSLGAIERSYKYAAKKRGLSFDLSRVYIDMLIHSPCFYCGEKGTNLMHGKHSYRSFAYNGIDRIDNTIGYTEKNTVSCCKMCNRCKSDLSISEFYEWITKAARHLLKKTTTSN